MVHKHKNRYPQRLSGDDRHATKEQQEKEYDKEKC